MSFRLTSPRPGALSATGPVDWVERYHQWAWGVFLRRRFRWAARALPSRIERTLEIGYGSGFFQYELARRSRLCIGLDIHPHAARVLRQLRSDGIASALVRADGACLPVREASVDAIIIVSALEFVEEPARCLRESRRALRPGGTLVCVRPRHLTWVDRLFRQLLGEEAEAAFRGGRTKVDIAARQELPGAWRATRPAQVPRWLAPYELIVYHAPAARQPRPVE